MFFGHNHGVLHFQINPKAFFRLNTGEGVQLEKRVQSMLSFLISYFGTPISKLVFYFEVHTLLRLNYVLSSPLQVIKVEISMQKNLALTTIFVCMSICV